VTESVERIPLVSEVPGPVLADDSDRTINDFLTFSKSAAILALGRCVHKDGLRFGRKHPMFAEWFDYLILHLISC
jgi:hypothetical protein